jgi:hypothetical protein
MRHDAGAGCVSKFRPARDYEIFALAGLPVALVIDGVRVATIGFHSSYDGLIAPGPHTINVVQIPHSARTHSDPIRLVVQPGQTYNLTAAKSGPRVVLR